MNKKCRRKSLRLKFISCGLKVFVPIFVIVGFVFFTYLSNQKIADIKNNSISSVRSSSLSVSLIQDEIKKITTYISLNEDIMDILQSDDVEELNKNLMLWTDNTTMEKLQDLISLSGFIRTFALYPENGVQPFLRGMDGSVNHYTIDRIRDTREYNFTKRQKYGMYWCAVQKNTRGTFLVNRYDKIVFYRELMDFTQTKQLCFMAIGINRDAFEAVCRNTMTREQEGYLVFNQTGEILCDVGSNSDELKLYIQRKIIDNFPEGIDVVNFSYQGDYVTCCRRDQDSFVVCNVIPQKVFTEFFMHAIFLFVGIMIVAVFALFFILELMYRFVNRPLEDLAEGISKFAEGDFTQHVKVSSEDEIGQVAHAFNKMVEDINSLINENYIIKMKESENELASLQAQINPHFLYNTLNSLYWQAMDQNNEKLADNIFSLSRLFQLVLSHGQQEIFVENEFELIERYLEVQKMRFNTKLQYSITLDEKIKNQKFSKLLLQPFVENSIEHGFSNKTSECNLSISGILQGDEMVFEIKDSGTGMSQEEIQKLFSGESKVGHDRVGGYAIKNIIDRIKLLYGERGSVHIESIIGKGTTVCVKVPFLP